MQIFVALATFAYLAVMFAFVGAVVGFFFGFVGVLWFGVEFAHLPLFGAGGAVGFARVAGPASSHDIHPVVSPVLCKRHDVFARQLTFMEIIAAVGADVAVAGK